MKIRVLTIAGKMPSWVEAGVADYDKRLPRDVKIDWVSLPLATRRKDRKAEHYLATEAQSILKQIREDDFVVALDVRGKSCSSEELAEYWQAWQAHRGDLVILIGGPDGLDQSCLARANQRLSLSALTLPHALVRVVLAEQLYRAWSLSIGHPYHRA
ncbi:23S rRNA (pseudouridine(1915)-N(3))-methyltransferase RlmH [Aequoribacter fuscus]|nr:23S rRNA (pseudouridine(1915)-N(3))-methyltransferase RlmH [Aequoribacter fuscus]QHJ87174.1 23S rRNA (pseudouridine(1915)-N(3))-methyltransferase RlmH [Aequoribacter fuscus]